MNDDRSPYRLYEEAVQSPEVELDLFDHAFRGRFGTDPVSLREDFCGTALLCRHWVESDAERMARGVDVDESVLSLAHEMNRLPLDEDEVERFELRRGDAAERSERTFDIITAGNYSWALLDDAALTAYFESARDCLEEPGLFALELFGGADLRRTLRHEHPADGFTYVWEQTRYDEASRELDAVIHFHLDSGQSLRDAFRYRFVVRPWLEIEAALVAAGFASVTLWVEEPSGGFSKRARAPESPVWGGYALSFTTEDDASGEKRLGAHMRQEDT